MKNYILAFATIVALSVSVGPSFAAHGSSNGHDCGDVLSNPGNYSQAEVDDCKRQQGE